MLPLFELYTGMLPVVEAQTRSYCETRPSFPTASTQSLTCQRIAADKHEGAKFYETAHVWGAAMMTNWGCEDTSAAPDARWGTCTTENCSGSCPHGCRDVWRGEDLYGTGCELVRKGVSYVGQLSTCDAQNTYIRHHWSSALEVPLMMLRHYLHTYNSSVAKRHLVPTAAATMTFFDQHWANASFFMQDAQCLESFSHCDQPFPQLAGLIQLLRGLLDAPKVRELFSPPQIAVFESLRQKVNSTQLPLYTSMNETHDNEHFSQSDLPLFAPCGKGGNASAGYYPGQWEQQNREPAMLYSTWPYELVGVNRTAHPSWFPQAAGVETAEDIFAMAVRSYKRRPYPTVPMVGCEYNGCSSHLSKRSLTQSLLPTDNQDSVFAANLGQVAEARHQLNIKWSSKRGPDDYGQARFPVWWGPSREAPDETCDYPGCNEVIDESRITLQHMLLQSDNHGERLILFPSWPHEWDVTFQIRAERNTTLSGEVKDGKLVSLRVVPEGRRKDVVVLPLHVDAPIKTDDVAPESRRRNVLMLASDDLRPLFGKAFGHPEVKTPNFDKFLEDGLYVSTRSCLASCHGSRIEQSVCV